jgi:hypothetical protein
MDDRGNTEHGEEFDEYERAAIVMRLIWAVVLVAALAAEDAMAGEPRWSVEALIGDAHNFESPTRIEHPAVPAASFDGRYTTRGLEGPLHYTFRASRLLERGAWEIQLLHHKLYLRDAPPGVEALSVSHGFNVVTLNRAFEVDHWRLRIGLGPVITHPEARIDGGSYDGPYELSGAAALIGVGRSMALTEAWSLGIEASFTLGHIEVHPAGEPHLEFSITNPAVHAQVGVGYRF